MSKNKLFLFELEMEGSKVLHTESHQESNP